MKIAITIAQIKPKLGNIEYNIEQILKYYKQAKGEIVLFPELCLTGYSPRDELFQKQFIKNCHKALLEILPLISQKICIISMPFEEDDNLYNACLALQNGKIIAKSFKTHLPNYEIFDEKRYFTPGKPAIFQYKGVKFGLPICEDIWKEDTCLQLKKQGAEVLLVPNASPFNYGKIEERIEVAKQRFEEAKMPIVYCNQVLCQDGILYDGTSFAFDGFDGSHPIYASSFEEDLLELILENGKFALEDVNFECYGKIKLLDQELTYKALIFGLKEYVKLSGFSKVLLGLSGGADSALTAVLAVKAFGAENVMAVLMPSKFTSKESVEDARKLAKNLGLKLMEVSIEKPLKAFNEVLSLSGLALENIQARIRGNILMALSNQHSAMVLTTGNKSEVAVGYCTIYGDMCGGYNPIKDLYKTQVFEVMKFINKVKIAKIPENIITKAPTAELREGQKDSDSLPDYAILDKILYEFIENRKLPEEITLFPKELVGEVWKLLMNSEYKRTQSAPGTRLSKQSFERAERRRNI